jgi:hypothetical protein
MQDLGIINTDVHCGYSNVTGIIVLKYIQMELKTLGLDITLNDLENVLCKIAIEYDDKKQEICIKDLCKLIFDANNSTKSNATDPIFYDNELQITMNLFRMNVTKKNVPRLYVRNFDSAKESVEKEPLIINWLKVGDDMHLSVEIKNADSFSKFFKKEI